MKATGIVRSIDDLGRTVIPNELRRTYGIKEGDPLEIFAEDDQLVLKKYHGDVMTCAHCGSGKDLFQLGKEYICQGCTGKMAERVAKGCRRMDVNNTIQMVEVPINLYAELIEARTVLEIIKRKAAVSKYSIERQFITDITGIELPDIKNEGGEF